MAGFVFYRMPSLTRRNFWIITFNSLASFVLAYLIVFFLNQFSYVLTAGMFGYPVTVNHATYFFHIEPYQWTHDAVFVIFSSGYVLTFLLGLLSLLGFLSLAGESAPVKVLFFWLILHSSNFVFGGLLLGNLLTEGIGHVFNWMYLLDTSRMIISIIGFFGLLMTALFSARLVAISSDAYFIKYNEKMAPFFITAQVLVPYIIGSALIFFYFYPKNMFHEKYGWMVLGVMILIFFIRARFLDDLLFEEDDNRSIRPMRGLIIFTILFFVLSRLIMGRGFTFHA
ncbi:MAG: hypothetical protein H3C41_00895 [Bacteroidales bacterium]|nr:hypothetical protein [Bacteroidales bacterium]